MEHQALAGEVARHFGTDPLTEHTAPERFQDLGADVPGLTAVNIQAVLNMTCAAAPSSSTYLEAGTHLGLSLISALLDNSDIMAISIDHTSRKVRDKLSRNLKRYGVNNLVRQIDGDVVTVLSGSFDRSIEVFFYDADHSFEITLLSLRAVRRHLAPRSVIVVDDSDWPMKRAAITQFISDNPEAELIASYRGEVNAATEWWHGLDIIFWTDTGRDFPRIPV